MDEDGPSPRTNRSQQEGGVALVVKSYGALVASILQLLGVVIYIAHWEATVDQRLNSVEGAQATISSNMSRLDGAREADQLHLAHVDDKIGDMVAKVNAMFSIMTQQSGTDADSTDTTAPPPIPMPSQNGNFPRPQGRKN